VKTKLGKIVYSTKSNYIQLVGDVKFLNFVIFGGASVVQKVKRKMQVFEIKHLHFVWYSEDYLFSNRFMEDLARIYRLRKYFPSFQDEKSPPL
jgi:hypothetical protein